MGYFLNSDSLNNIKKTIVIKERVRVIYYVSWVFFAFLLISIALIFVSQALSHHYFIVWSALDPNKQYSEWLSVGNLMNLFENLGNISMVVGYFFSLICSISGIIYLIMNGELKWKREWLFRLMVNIVTMIWLLATFSVLYLINGLSHMEIL